MVFFAFMQVGWESLPPVLSFAQSNILVGVEGECLPLAAATANASSSATPSPRGILPLKPPKKKRQPPSGNCRSLTIGHAATHHPQLCFWVCYNNMQIIQLSLINRSWTFIHWGCC